MMGIYYYEILNILVTSPSSPTQIDDEKYEKDEGEPEVGVEDVQNIAFVNV